MSNTDTPRADNLAFWGRDMGGDSGPPHFECVDADYMRDLERELNAAHARIAELEHAIKLQIVGSPQLNALASQNPGGRADAIIAHFQQLLRK